MDKQEMPVWLRRMEDFCSSWALIPVCLGLMAWVLLA